MDTDHVFVGRFWLIVGLLIFASLVIGTVVS